MLNLPTVKINLNRCKIDPNETVKLSELNDRQLAESGIYIERNLLQEDKQKQQQTIERLFVPSMNNYLNDLCQDVNKNNITDPIKQDQPLQTALRPLFEIPCLPVDEIDYLIEKDINLIEFTLFEGGDK